MKKLFMIVMVLLILVSLPLVISEQSMGCIQNRFLGLSEINPKDIKTEEDAFKVFSDLLYTFMPETIMTVAIVMVVF